MVGTLVKKKGSVKVANLIWPCNGDKFRIAYDYERTFTYQYEYWLDGFKFYIGTYGNKGIDAMVEVSLLAPAINADEGCRSLEAVVERFEKKLENSHLQLGEVIRNFSFRNLDLPLWQIKSLMV